MPNRQELLESLRGELYEKYTSKKLAELLGVNKVWLVSVLHGVNRLTYPQARTLLELIGEPEKNFSKLVDYEQVLTSPPDRNIIQFTSTDPFLHRVRETMALYGTSIRQIVHEEIGDGIISAIDCKINVDVVEEKGAKRVKLTIDGKYLPYADGTIQK